LRRAEAANRRDNRRAPLEFREEDFSESELSASSEKT
jgi:hypothetical protein